MTTHQEVDAATDGLRRMSACSDASADPARCLIILVDPYSTGCMVGQEIKKRGYPLLR